MRSNSREEQALGRLAGTQNRETPTLHTDADSLPSTNEQVERLDRRRLDCFDGRPEEYRSQRALQL